MGKILRNIAIFISYLWPKKVSLAFASVSRHFYSGFISRRFKTFGAGTTVFSNCFFEGEKYMSIGDRVSIGRRTIITAYPVKGHEPELLIGSCSAIGGNCHITAINSIHIGEKVVIGEGVTITDNSHGYLTADELDIFPFYRLAVSKGPVIIEDCVWIGDKATILPNVRIGKGSVIGANAVVTKDVPKGTIVVGNPAAVIRTIE